jgi:hypothetical protein
MDEATNNVGKMVPNQDNLVACVYCVEIYTTKRLSNYHNCLWCSKCKIDAIVVIDKDSQLYGLTDVERKALLEKWYKEGFTPIE